MHTLKERDENMNNFGQTWQLGVKVNGTKSADDERHVINPSPANRRKGDFLR